MNYKRRILSLFLAVVFLTVFTFGCDKDVASDDRKNRPVFDCFSVHYLDVGEGDCILVHFADGKNMLIDSGEKDEDLSEYVIGFLKDGGVGKIDYLVLTHPDSDHVGNAVDIINSFDIGTAYLPDIYEGHLDLFPTYKEVVNLIAEKNIKVNNSDYYDVVVGEDYGVAFLSPAPKSIKGSSYFDFNATATPTATQSNALSPIIYIETQGIRFVFTGDAPVSQENAALDWIKVGGVHYTSQGVQVNLSAIDFLKIAHHGSDDGSGENFLSVTTPANAVISVGGNNYYGHPSDSVLARLITANENVNILRTDVHGTVSVEVSDGAYEIITDESVA